MVLDWVTVITATIILTITGGITTGATATIITTVQRNVVTIQPAMKPGVWPMVAIPLTIKAIIQDQITTSEMAKETVLTIAATPAPSIVAAVPVTEPLIALLVIALLVIAQTAPANRLKEAANNQQYWTPMAQIIVEPQVLKTHLVMLFQAAQILQLYKVISVRTMQNATCQTTATKNQLWWPVMCLVSGSLKPTGLGKPPGSTKNHSNKHQYGSNRWTANRRFITTTHGLVQNDSLWSNANPTELPCTAHKFNARMYKRQTDARLTIVWSTSPSHNSRQNHHLLSHNVKSAVKINPKAAKKAQAEISPAVQTIGATKDSSR